MTSWKEVQEARYCAHLILCITALFLSALRLEVYANPPQNLAQMLVIHSPLIMTTDPMIDSTPATAVSAPLPADGIDSAKTTDDRTPEEKLAAAEAEVKMWKGRADKANKEKKAGSASVSEDDMNWAINNNPRVALVKDVYEKELADLESLGAKVTNAAKSKALEAAELKAGVAKSTVSTPDTSFPSPSIDRSATRQVRMTEFDQQLKVKPETIEKYRDYVEGR